MTHVLILLLASLTGIVAGLRAFTAPAVVSWAAFLDWLHLDGTWALWMGNSISVGLLTVLLVVELITDQLPKTPSHKTPPQFIAAHQRWFLGSGDRRGVGLHVPSSGCSRCGEAGLSCRNARGASSAGSSPRWPAR
jgi:uncharacterized membrane protein